MWDAEIDGRVLNFHLSGINNQNFLMTDEQTGTWWQQVSGEAIRGQLKGRRLDQIFHDELSYGVWKRERPEGRVLRPDPVLASSYASENWESEIDKMKVVVPPDDRDRLRQRELVIGIRANGAARAYPFAAVLRHNPVLDELGGLPILIVAGEDGKSVRAFDRTVDGQALEFFASPSTGPVRLVDSRTGTIWDFSGVAVDGELKGRRLAPISLLKDFWFDWKNYNPATSVYSPADR